MNQGINARKEAGLRSAIGEVLGHETCLLEVKKGIHAGQQRDKQRNAEQQRRAESVNRAVKRVAAQRRIVAGRQCAGAGRERFLQVFGAEQGEQQ